MSVSVRPTVVTQPAHFLEQMIEALEVSDFEKAQHAATHLDLPLPISLFVAMQSFKASSPVSMAEYFQKQAKDHQTSTFLSTFSYHTVHSWPKHLFLQEGDGLIRLKNSGLELVTLGQHRIGLIVPKLPKAKTLMVHLILSLPSNVGEDFFIRLEGTHPIELNLSNTSLNWTEERKFLSLNARKIKLYSLKVEPDFFSIYINGLLLLKKKKTNNGFDKLSIMLEGSTSADLSAWIHGLEIQSSWQKVECFFGDDSKILSARIENNSGHDLKKVYDLLKNIDGVDLSSIQEHILLKYLNLACQRQGVQEWMIQELLNHLDSKKAKDWVRTHQGILPSPILTVSHLSANFMLMPNRRLSLSTILLRRKREQFDVLNDISFDVFPGDIVGIVGPNGAGKSTLLKALCGLVPISHGNIILRARHLLLSAGLGARNELTGRENIYTIGTFMGLSKKEIDRLFYEVLDFSELGPAIDKPFKYYSDGMKGRLVFSIATSVSPDILMLDELLSAGDIKFQKKAAERMQQMIERARAVIIVTHSVSFVRERCNKALFLWGGKLAAYGDPTEVVGHYLRYLRMPSQFNDAEEFASVPLKTIDDSLPGFQ